MSLPVPFNPPPNTPILSDPTKDSIWRRWFEQVWRRIKEGALGGDVVGPSSSTDNAVARFDGTTGKLLQNSGVIIDDSNNLTVPSLTSGRFVSATTGGQLTTATTESANTVFAGPTTGAAAVPAFRALMAADIPSNAPLTIGTTPIASGTVGRLLYEGASNLLQESAGMSFDGTTLAVTGLSNSGNTVLGDAAGDSLTINAGTWTIGNPNTITQAAGTVGGGGQQLNIYNTNFTADSGGTSQILSHTVNTTLNGANNAINVSGQQFSVAHSGTGTITAVRGMAAQMFITSSGIVSAADNFVALPPSLTSTGSFGTIRGFRVQNQGHATLVTNAIGFDADNATVSGTLTVSFQSAQNSGTGAWGYLHTGTANNAFNGNVRIGSTTAPTVALDVTGSAAISGNTTLGDASADTLTINAGTWTLGNNFSATRAIGTAAAGAVTSGNWNTIVTGDSGGTTDVRNTSYQLTTQGANAFSQSINALLNNTHSGTNTVTSAFGIFAAVNANSSGGITTARIFFASSPQLSSGVITTSMGFSSGDLGHATLVTNAIGHNAGNMTAAATLTAGFRSEMTSGTGKWSFLDSGGANNAFIGNVRIGSTTAPTVALDVTGAALISSTLGVTGTLSANTIQVLTGTTATVYNTSATTVNAFGGASVALNVGNSGGANTISGATTFNQAVTFGSTARLKAFTVGTLPAAGTAGRMAYVTDALAPTYLATIVGGGAIVTPVFDNGTNWVAM